MPDEARPHRNWVTIFLRNRYLLIITIIVILVGGLSALRSLPRLEDPVITNRSPLVITAFPGASADRVEALVSEPLERTLQEIPEIKHLETTSRAGTSIAAIELQDAVTAETSDTIFAEIRDRIGDAASRFPEGVLPPFFDDKRNAVAFSMIVGLHWDEGTIGSPGMLTRQAEVLADRLRDLSGTELVRLYGEPQEEILVEVDPRELAALDLQIGQLATAVREADAKSPAGQLRSGTAERLLEVEGELDTIERVRSAPIRQSSDGSLVRVGDVAKVERSIRNPPEQMALTNGERTIFVAARILSDQRIDTWTAQASQALAEFRQDLGGGITADVIFEQNTYTSHRLGQLAGNLLLGAIVVMAVIFITMGWRSALIISSALPLTASLTLFILALQGGKLHQMSIFGMIIALGLLIDNAIVVTDEVRKHLQAGKSPAESVRAALHHLMVPLFASTLTTILAFLPILLLPGNAGDFVSPISRSVIIALAASYVISITCIAALAGWFGRAGRAEQRLPDWLSQGVGGPRLANQAGGWLGEWLRRPLRAILLAATLPLAGFALAPTMGSQFFPRTDRDMFEVEVWMPVGTSLEGTRHATQEIEAILRERPAVQGVHWMHGASFPSVYYNLIMNKDRSPFYAHAIVEATDPEAVRAMIREVQQTIDARVPSAQVVVSKFAQGPPAPADVEIRLLGPSIPKLQDLGEQIRLELSNHPGILQTRVTMPRGEPKLWFDADEAATRQTGLTLIELADQLRGQLDGVVAGSVIEATEVMPVRIRLASGDRDDIVDLTSINFIAPDTQSGWVPLPVLGDLVLQPEQGGITRRDSQRNNTILGYAREGTLPINITNDVMDHLRQTGFALPAGYRLELGGETENQSEAVGNLTLYLPVLIVITLATLILTFQSLRIAAILLLTAPLSAGFGLLATFAAGFPMSFNTIIGSLGLMGLAFNSSIIVIAALRSDPAAARGEPSAMVSQIMGTMRHLISTTFTTIGSFLPLLIFIGGEFWPPLAIVLAGGVGGSTLLAVLMTPALYHLFHRSNPPFISTSPPEELPYQTLAN